MDLTFVSLWVNWPDWATVFSTFPLQQATVGGSVLLVVCVCVESLDVAILLFSKIEIDVFLFSVSLFKKRI